MSKSKIYSLIFLGLIFFSSNIFGQLSANDYKMFQLKALKKIDKIGVFVWDVEGIGEDTLLTSSLNIDTLTSYISQSLLDKNINAVSYQEAGSLPGGPCFDVMTKINIDTVSNLCVYNISTRLVQDVQLTRNSKILHYSASTWSKDRLNITSRDSLTSNILDSIEELIGLFSEDYNLINE